MLGCHLSLGPHESMTTTRTHHLSYVYNRLFLNQLNCSKATKAKYNQIGARKDDYEVDSIVVFFIVEAGAHFNRFSIMVRREAKSAGLVGCLNSPWSWVVFEWRLAARLATAFTLLSHFPIQTFDYFKFCLPPLRSQISGFNFLFGRRLISQPGLGNK